MNIIFFDIIYQVIFPSFQQILYNLLPDLLSVFSKRNNSFFYFISNFCFFCKLSRLTASQQRKKLSPQHFYFTLIWSKFNIFKSSLIHNRSKNNRCIRNILRPKLLIHMFPDHPKKLLILNLNKFPIPLFPLIIHNNNQPMIITNKALRIKTSLPIIYKIRFKIFLAMNSQIKNQLRHIYFP